MFLKIRETQNVTNASGELHHNQSAVSIQFKNFQDQIKKPLTEVMVLKIYITDFGR